MKSGSQSGLNYRVRTLPARSWAKAEHVSAPLAVVDDAGNPCMQSRYHVGIPGAQKRLRWSYLNESIYNDSCT